jgi:DNA-binding winged helix-turn-helix (wHTH) protein/tetratricopeptide (TPR) repeat protein
MTLYRFGRCELDTERVQLLVAGIERHVEPQVFDLLHYLVKKGGKVSTHEELIESVWKGRVVTDSAISVRINSARRVVGDTGARQEVIRTVPRRGFQLALDVTKVEAGISTRINPDGEGKTASAERKPIVGIFPFDPQSNELPAYLLRGIVEDIATELSRFHSIEVLAPYSTFRHDFGKIDQGEIAKSLGITHIVSGNIKGGASVQGINVWLIDANSGVRIWSERYRVYGDDLFAAQDDAVFQIVSSLVHGLTEHQSTVVREKPTKNLSAYECLLRGLQIYKWGVNSLEEAKQALFWFDRAVELDEDYARARAWRECCLSSFWSSPPKEKELETSAQNLRVALSIDEHDHEVHRLKGAIHMCSGEHEMGEYHLAKSVELNPNDAHILLKIGMYRSFLANSTDDLTYIDTAFLRNPLHPAWYWQDRAIALFSNGGYEEAIQNLQRSHSDTEIARLYLAASNALLGQLDEARSHIKVLHGMNPDANIDWLAVAYPTRCYENSEHKQRFVEGLLWAGL